MKQVDKLIVGSFLKSFIAILSIVLFTLLVQIFYANMQTIIGKNLGIMVYLKLLYYMGVVSISLAAPIAILIATVLNFASLSENFELIALKNLGISFSRILRPLIITVGILSCGLIYMTNFYVPRSYKNMRNMLFNLEQVNPLNSLREGFFFEDIPGYSIYIGAKDKKKGIFKDVIVYNNNDDNFYTIAGESAKLYNSQDKKSIIFQIDNGNAYVEMPPTQIKQTPNDVNDFMRMNFSVQKIFVDSSNFNFSNTFTEKSSRLSSTKTTSIFKKILQEKKKYDGQKEIIVNKLCEYYGIKDEEENDNINNDEQISDHQKETSIESLLDQIDNYDAQKIEEEIVNNKKSLEQDLKQDIRLLNIYKRSFQELIFEVLSRFLVALACFVMVILGACLGSLLKKGELSLAMGFAALFVAIYNVSVILCEKMFYANILNLFFGSTGAILALLPFLIFFYIHAKNDSQIFKGDFRLFLLNKKF